MTELLEINWEQIGQADLRCLAKAVHCVAEDEGHASIDDLKMWKCQFIKLIGR